MKPRNALILEGLTYRLGDVAIGGAITFVFAFLVTRDFAAAAEVGSAASLVENALNTLWYWLNRKYWTKETRFKP